MDGSGSSEEVSQSMRRNSLRRNDLEAVFGLYLSSGSVPCRILYRNFLAPMFTSSYLIEEFLRSNDVLTLATCATSGI